MIVLLLTNILMISVATSIGGTEPYEVAKPGCQDECGGIKIPFPFGIGDGCFLDTNATYRINCDNSTTPAAPFLVNNKTMINTEVLSISVEDHSIRVSSRIAYQCYENGKPVPSTTVHNTCRLQNLQPFNLSSTKNRLVAIGCDTTAKVGELGSSNELIHPITGCMASCYSLNVVRNGTCSGAGCCETYIISMYQPSISVDSLCNHSGVEYDNPCSYAFLGEVGSYVFSIASLAATAKDCDKMRFPVVYDWSVALSGSCSEARKAGNGTLICGPNAECVDGNGDGWGYRCQCLKGYTGNPYLPQGCEDINECLEERLNDCQFQDYCVNKDGRYDCGCGQFYFGSENGTFTNPCRYGYYDGVGKSKF